MLSELIVRFIAGGAIVSLFAAIGDMIQPKKLAVRGVAQMTKHVVRGRLERVSHRRRITANHKRG